MKKVILAVLLALPFAMSCNVDDQGFIDPFPEDEYHAKGFNFEPNEKINRPLTSTETELLNKTMEKSTMDTINRKLLHEEVINIHERDYERAFAGEFSAGYDSCNVMHDESITAFYQEQELEGNNEASLKYRKQITSNSNSTYDYSYGKNTLKNNTTSIRFFTDDPEDPEPKSANVIKKYVELNKIDDSDPLVLDPTVRFVIEAQYETGKTDYTSASIVGKAEEVGTFDYLQFITTPQTDYIPVLTSSDPIPGAFDDNVIILVKEEHQQYNQEAEKEEDRGIYKLPDGRSYRAAVNKMTISRLKKAKDERKDVETKDLIGDFYYVEYSRIYAETVITSDVIQPNVPITFLKNPIVINYREETHEFKLITSSKSIEPESIEVEIEE